MKAFIAIFVVSATVGVSAYHWTENAKAPPASDVTVAQQPIVVSPSGWNAPRFKKPVPLNIVAPVRSKPDERDRRIFQLATLERPVMPKLTFVVPSKKVPEFEGPCRAAKPPRSSVSVAADRPSEASRDSLTAIPVGAERVVEARADENAVASVSATSSAMPTGRACCPPRRARTSASYAIDRHLRPGARMGP